MEEESDEPMLPRTRPDEGGLNELIVLRYSRVERASDVIIILGWLCSYTTYIVSLPTTLKAGRRLTN